MASFVPTLSWTVKNQSRKPMVMDRADMMLLDGTTLNLMLVYPSGKRRLVHLLGSRISHSQKKQTERGRFESTGAIFTSPPRSSKVRVHRMM
jgi:hypothetical protein